MQSPSPQELVPIVIPIFGMLTGIVITGFITLGPVGRAIGRVILNLFGGGKEQALPAGELSEVRGLLEEQGRRLETIQHQVAELLERQDFTERLLAQARGQARLPGAKDANG
jgi:hypothetical protein